MSFLPIRERLLSALALLFLLAAVIVTLWLTLGCTLFEYHKHIHNNQNPTSHEPVVDDTARSDDGLIVELPE